MTSPVRNGHRSDGAIIKKSSYCRFSKHSKKACILPHKLRCSYCRKEGVRSDECNCRISTMVRGERLNRKYEAAILVCVEDTRVQELRMGIGVL